MNKSAAFFILALTCLAVLGCNEPGYDTAVSLYNSSCVEAKTINFESINPATATCNGRPIFFALIEADSSDYELDTFRKYLFKEVGKQVGLDMVDPRTGMSLAMDALALNQLQMFMDILPYMRNPGQKDHLGRTYLHYLALNTDLLDWIFPPRYHNPPALLTDYIPAGSDLNAKDSEGKTAAQIAYEHKNYVLVWMLAGRGADLSFLPKSSSEIDPGFFFNVSSELDPELFDRFPGFLKKRFNGHFVITPEGFPTSPGNYLLTNYGIDNFAVDNGIRNLIYYLSDRGIIATKALVGRDLRDEDVDVSFYLLSKFVYKDPPFYNSGTKFGSDDYGNGIGQNVAHIACGLLKSSDLDSTAFNTKFISWPNGNGFENFVKEAASYHLLDKADILGQTPLHVWLGNWEHMSNRSPSIWQRWREDDQLKLLLKYSTNHLQLTRNGDSLLSFAVRTGHKNLVDTLLQADPRFRDFILRQNRQGQSPFSYAKSHDPDIYQDLKNAR